MASGESVGRAPVSQSQFRRPKNMPIYYISSKWMRKNHWTEPNRAEPNSSTSNKLRIYRRHRHTVFVVATAHCVDVTWQMHFQDGNCMQEGALPLNICVHRLHNFHIIPKIRAHTHCVRISTHCIVSLFASPIPRTIRTACDPINSNTQLVGAHRRNCHVTLLNRNTTLNPKYMWSCRHAFIVFDGI